ncbi:metallophosphoesterase [Brachybacterium vulturis]|uniref:Metallophosphoesterase n=1 Tax=Brachybacterium vulturis TaxID=2017484 RepID=A0A291GLG4_9MICO|nr:metallophosphoesterase [Brachybacterium vulturis]ATG51047.1 metallophosphoesterase [Brachybacterium vulturis]
MRPALAAAGIVGGLGLGAAAATHVWARHIEIHRFTLREVELRILPPGTRSVRVLHLSDIHLMPDQQRKLDFLEHLSLLRPHLVIDTGDNIASAASIPVLAEVLAPLLQRPGAFVRGSNDMFEPMPKNPARYLLPDSRPAGLTDPGEPTLPVGELTDRLSEHGWRDLTNTRSSIELGGLEVRLVGVDDPHLELDEMPAPLPPSTPLPAHGNVLRLGVAHAPYRRVLDSFVADGADLVLAGHTHGGQLRVPGVGALVTNCDIPRRQARGLSTWQGVPLNVSAGMGASPYSNYRLFTPPEATLLTLRAPKPSPVR